MRDSGDMYGVMAAVLSDFEDEKCGSDMLYEKTWGLENSLNDLNDGRVKLRIQMDNSEIRM